MSDYIMVSIGIVFLLISLCAAYKNRHTAGRCISCILAGIFMSTFFMIYPTAWIKGDDDIYCKTLYRMVSSLIYAIKTLGGGQNISQVETIGFDGVFKGIYIAINYICFALAPVITSGLIISFIGDMGERIRYMMSFAKECHVFSELNGSSLALAKLACAKKRKIVFCNTRQCDKMLLTEAGKTGAINLYKACDDIKIRRRFTKCSFYLVSPDGDENIRVTRRLISEYKNTKKQKIIINSFVAESSTDIEIIENMLRPQVLEDNDDKRLEDDLTVSFINENTLICNNLLFEYPLYDLPEQNLQGQTGGSGRKKISVMIAGCGKTGMQMLKTVVWCGRLEGYDLKIRVYDKEADRIRGEFYSQCPGLAVEIESGFIESGFSESQFSELQFIKTDAESDDFEKKIEESADATYVVVAMDDDRLNISVADYLYGFFRIKNNFDENYVPHIFARVRSDVKYRNYCNRDDRVLNKKIHIFGTTESVYRDRTLFNTKLENMAFAVHLAYLKCLDCDKDSEKYKRALFDFRTSEYARRSSTATALHIIYKLRALGIMEHDGHELTEEMIRKFKDMINSDSGEKVVEKLAMGEHIRWNYFMCSEGYRPASTDMMLSYAVYTGSHKDDFSKLHPCITGWDNLQNVENIYNTRFNKNKNFKESDYDIIRKIPEIFEAACRLDKEGVEK